MPEPDNRGKRESVFDSHDSEPAVPGSESRVDLKIIFLYLQALRLGPGAWNSSVIPGQQKVRDRSCTCRTIERTLR
ncbi:MAG: hypothetical protein C4576_34850 [Desulfobacteraceae bacterium]|nr:MAG: hypothetical protein C4576_34850 [Desulfobacteraceae bacterium]